MSYGLEITSAFNSILIDENVVCARRVATHTISTSAPNGFGVCTGSVTVGGAVDNYIALTKDSRFHTVRLKLHGAGGYTAEVFIESASATSIDVTILGTTPPGASSQFGLEVFSPSGGRVFSTAENNIPLLGDVLLPTYTSAAQSVAVSGVPAGRTIMMPFAYGLLGFDVVPVNPNQSRLQTGFGRVAGNAIEVKVGALAIIGGGTAVGYENYLTTNYLPIFLE